MKAVGQNNKAWQELMIRNQKLVNEITRLQDQNRFLRRKISNIHLSNLHIVNMKIDRETQTESNFSFIRPSSAKKPTYAGAARMIAAKLNDDNDGDYPKVKPSDISVSRIEALCYACR